MTKMLTQAIHHLQLAVVQSSYGRALLIPSPASSQKRLFKCPANPPTIPSDTFLATL
jgi:hypothetical protein